MKIGVIGMGRVGTSVAVSVLTQGVARELLVNDLHVAESIGGYEPSARTANWC